jgi:D-alanyl-D-alanine carboxypeptidase
MDQYFRHPRLTWANLPVYVQTSQLLTATQAAGEHWSPLLTLTTDSTSATWADEGSPQTNLFYELSVSLQTNWASKLQLALDRARENAGAKGASAVVISSNGIWQGTSGFSDPKTAINIQPAMRFGIGSVTKTFTTALIMQLVEEGKLSLEDPLSKWLPDYPNITNTITVRQLLNHTSGVYDFYNNPGYWAMVSKTNQLYRPQDTLQLIQKPLFSPGKGWLYSDSNFVLLGMVAEAVLHSPIADEFHRRFLDPLQLRSTYLGAAEPETGERAHPFSTLYTGTLIDVSDRLWLPEWSVEWTAGAMNSTAYDLARWIHALYGGRVLKPESLNAMTQWTSLSGGTYGLGTLRLTTSKGDFWGHGGFITGYVTLAAYSPSLEGTVVILVNQDNVDFVAMWNNLVNSL